MNEILLFQFTRLRKSEFRSTFGELISIAEKHDPEALHIEAALSRMKDALREVEKLEIPERKNPMTLALNDARDKRNKLVMYMFAQTRTHLNGTNEAMKAAAEVFMPFIKRILDDFKRMDYSTQDTHEKLFFIELDATAALRNAAGTLGLGSTIEDMRQIGETVRESYELKRVITSECRKMKTDEIKKQLSALMIDFLTYIELVSADYPALNYTPLINELNVALQAQRLKLLNRSKNRRQTEQPENVVTGNASAPTAVNNN